MGTSRLLLWTGETMTGPFLGNAFEFRTKVGNRGKTQIWLCTLRGHTRQLMILLALCQFSAWHWIELHPLKLLRTSSATSSRLLPVVSTIIAFSLTAKGESARELSISSLP